MERDFSNIKITPEELMIHELSNGKITFSEYVEWLMTDRTWDSVKNIIMKKLINKASQQ